MGSRISPIVVSQAAMAHRMAAISSTPSRDRASSISSVPSPISMPASSARSGFHHSMNYRSAVVIGPVRHVEDETERADALDAIIDHVVPGRSQTLRPATRKELAATAVLALPLHEASVKVRQGAPVDEPSDAATGSWAGHMPVGLGVADPITDGFSREPVPFHVLERVRDLNHAAYRRAAQ